MLRRNYYDVPPGTDLPHVVHVIVEIPKGRRSTVAISELAASIK